MLVKRSRKNQIAIPKVILDRAGLSAEDIYFDIQYSTGRIILTPMELEVKIPIDSLMRFEKQVLKHEAGDNAYRSMEEVIHHLRDKRRG